MKVPQSVVGAVEYSRLSELLPGVEMFPAIRAPGVLGRYDGEGRFHALPRLTEWVGDTVKRVIDSYTTSGDRDELILGSVTRTLPSKKWRSATLVFSDQAFRQFTTGGRDGKSPFEHRNRERSIYQGMQVLLDYRSIAMPDVPVFCPVLYIGEPNRTTSRDEGDVGHLDDEQHVAVKVLNLIGPLKLDERKAPWVQGLIRLIRNVVIFEDARSYDGMSV